MDDDRFGIDLLAPLRREPLRPSTVDVRRAIARVERRRTAVRASAAGAAVLVILAVGWTMTNKRDARPGPPLPAASGPTSAGPVSACRPEELELPAGYHPFAMHAGDPSGRYLAAIATTDKISERWVVLWDGRKPIVLPAPAETPNDVNSAGVVVGVRGGWDDKAMRAWVYRDGKVQDLAGGAGSIAASINDKGQVAGVAGGRPVFWPDAGAAPVTLPVPAGYEGPAEVVGIDEDGTVAGNLYAKGGGTRAAVVWMPDGRVVVLPAPTVNGTPSTGTIVKGIRNGWASGSWGTTVARWNLRAGGAPVVLAGAAVTAGPNVAGWVAVVTGDEPEIDTGDRRVRLTAPEHVERANGRLAVSAATISDDGRTLGGNAVVKDGTRPRMAAIVWTCR